MITDDNTLEDIGGVIWCLQEDLAAEPPEFPLAPRFGDLIERIELKLSKNKNKIRHNWFSTALQYAQEAQLAFRNGQASEANRHLAKCWEYLEQGNKAHRPTSVFIVSPDGATSLKIARTRYPIEQLFAREPLSIGSFPSPEPVGGVTLQALFTHMDPQRQKAYRHLLYTALVHMRAGDREVVWWNPASWQRTTSDLRQLKDLADYFHNLALFSVWDFDQFDEEQFWQDMTHFGKTHGPELVDRFRRIFDEYVAGRAAYTC